MIETSKQVAAQAATSQRIAIIADDLTGANDSGLQFAACGFDVRVFLGDPHPEQLDACDIAVVDTQTRAMLKCQARAHIESVSRRLADAGVVRLFKKIDSTMRGNVGAEIDVAAAIHNADITLLTPAYPAMGRVVKGGQLWVDGQLVHDSAIARDPATPVESSDLLSLIGNDLTDMQAVCLDRVAIARVDETVRQLCLSLAAGKRLVGICDADSTADLQAIVALGGVLEGLGLTVLWAGSAGLAEHLPRHWGLTPVPFSVPTLAPAKTPPLLVLGSVHPTSVKQLDAAAAALDLGVVVVPGEALLEEGPARSVAIASAIRELKAARNAQVEALVLTTAHHRDDIGRALAFAASLGLSKAQTGRLIAAGLAEITCAVLDPASEQRLVATGGDTVRAIMERAAINSVKILGAVAPGLPVVESADGPRMLFVTKAGGFGQADALAQALTYFRRGHI
jgi:uncharacterized protein YgbK (DUF1537 family)